MPAPEPWTIRPYQPGDEAAIVSCHNAVFAAVGGPAGSARSLSHWRWKFAANPTGQSQLMLAMHAHEGVLGVYGAIPLQVTFAGQRRLAGQVVDLCVLPHWWKQGGEPGLFARLGRAFLDRWLGTGPEQSLFLYGLPVAAWRRGASQLGWQIVRDWDITFRELPPGAVPRPVPDDLVVAEVARFGADVDQLFARVEPSLGIATVRDSRYLNWRYADHPDRQHVLFTCRDRSSDALRGIAVYGVGDAVRPNTGCLLDWLLPADDGEAMTALLGAVERRAVADGTGLLCSTWNHLDPRFLAMQERGYRVRGTQWFLVLASAAHDPVYFRENWYFTLGDSDLV